MPFGDHDGDPGADGQQHLEHRRDRPGRRPPSTRPARCDRGEDPTIRRPRRRSGSRSRSSAGAAAAAARALGREQAEEDREDQGADGLGDQEGAEQPDEWHPGGGRHRRRVRAREGGHWRQSPGSRSIGVRSIWRQDACVMRQKQAPNLHGTSACLSEIAFERSRGYSTATTSGEPVRVRPRSRAWRGCSTAASRCRGPVGGRLGIDALIGLIPGSSATSPVA